MKIGDICRVKEDRAWGAAVNRGDIVRLVSNLSTKASPEPHHEAKTLQENGSYPVGTLWYFRPGIDIEVLE